MFGEEKWFLPPGDFSGFKYSPEQRAGIITALHLTDDVHAAVCIWELEESCRRYLYGIEQSEILPDRERLSEKEQTVIEAITSVIDLMDQSAECAEGLLTADLKKLLERGIFPGTALCELYLKGRLTTGELEAIAGRTYLQRYLFERAIWKGLPAMKNTRDKPFRRNLIMHCLDVWCSVNEIERDEISVSAKAGSPVLVFLEAATQSVLSRTNEQIGRERTKQIVEEYRSGGLVI